VALGALVTSANASAYCRTKACDTEPSYGDVWDEEPQPTECLRNAQGCFLEGTPLHWPSACISFGVQRDGSQSSGIDFETAEAVIQAGFDTWAAADCGGGQTPSFRIVADGPIACGSIEYNEEGSNANVFLFRENDWPYSTLGAALALTTVTFYVETGEIYDVDVELNSHETTFTTTDALDGIISDLSSVVTHEIGHFLGLSHSASATAVMRDDGYEMGTTSLRVLDPDDIQGICEVFPPGSAPGSRCEPRNGFTSECGGSVVKTEGCSLGRAPAKTPLRPFALALFFAAALAARRARRTAR